MFDNELNSSTWNLSFCILGEFRLKNKMKRDFLDLFFFVEVIKSSCIHRYFLVPFHV